jgi:hypothetical protein
MRKTLVGEKQFNLQGVFAMTIRGFYRVMVLRSLWVLMLAGLLASSLSGQVTEKKYAIQRINEPPRIDGRIDEQCWKKIEPVSGFYQFNPQNGVPASEETQIWMAYDQNNIYFACYMKDRQPEKIWAELTPRNAYENNDSISVILDTYHDQRTSISFTVNPKGIQKNTVETIWRCQALQFADGWSAEIAIPFKSLRFSTEKSQVWGVNFERYIPHLNETDYWTRVERDKPFLLQMGEIQGLADIRSGRNMEFFPYIGFRSSRQKDGENKKDDKLAYGLDFKYGITSNLILDLTASPDFSHVESDPFIYQLSPYETYFMENRPFFSEGSQYFQAAGEYSYGPWGPSYSMFYSRRIDNPRAAAKVTGKTNGWSFGALGAIQDENTGPDSYFTVARVQKDIFNNSQIGFYYTGFERSGDYNRNIAVDYSFNFKDVYFVRGQNLFSLNQGQPNKHNAMHFFQFQCPTDTGWQWDLEFRRVEENVRLRTGYASQTDFQKTYLELGYAWRYQKGTLQRWSLIPMVTLNHDTTGNAVGQNYGLGSWINFFNQLMLEFKVNTGRSKYQVFGGQEKLLWTADYIPSSELVAEMRWFQGGLLKEISLMAASSHKGIYDNEFTTVAAGAETYINGELTLRPRSNLELSGEIGWTRQVLDRDNVTVFDGMTYATGLHYQLSRNFFLTARLLGETRDDQYSADILAGYFFGAGNVIQLAYKKSTRNEIGQKIDAHSITLKISYLLRI